MCLVLFPIPYYTTHTTLGYRHPIDPFMTIFTVYTVAHLATFIAKHSTASTHEPRP
jgi:hypothetical protein